MSEIIKLILLSRKECESYKFVKSKILLLTFIIETNKMDNFSTLFW